MTRSFDSGCPIAGQEGWARLQSSAESNLNRVGSKVTTAVSLCEQGQLAEAEAVLRQALAIEPRHVTALAELGYVARRRGDRAEALAAFQTASAIDPKHIGLKAAAAGLRELGRLEEAVH